MSLEGFATTDYWRAVILYGLNTATYKIALAQCLARFLVEDKAQVSMADLAEAFFDIYLARLENGKPQLSHPYRQTVMEAIIGLHRIGKLDRDTAIQRVENEAFDDVIPRFHIVGKQHIPVRFYEHTETGLVLTDNAFDVWTSQQGSSLMAELGSRWDLLEAAFQIKRENSELINDIRALYLVKGYERTDITGTRSTLNGYQNGNCFYCSEPMAQNDVHVDHMIPRQLLHHDEIWNLVLAHGFCNEQKSDALPGDEYVAKLVERNEHFIASNHPIKAQLMKQLGTTPDERRRFVQQVYEHAKVVIGYTWQGIRGYNPSTDPFYKTFIRSMSR